MPDRDSTWCKVSIICLAIVLTLGIFLRLPPHLFGLKGPLHAIGFLHPKPGYTTLGFDEGMYAEYVSGLATGGLTSYPDIVGRYIEVQERLTGSILPPVRFLYICAAYVWHLVFREDVLWALRDVAALFSALTLGLSALVAWRLRGPAWAIGVAALMAFAPTQIHMSQHALVDGFFAFWALLCLWLLWENLRAPGNWRWTAAFIMALALLVLTKENSFFVWCAMVALIVANRWLQFGKVTREVLLGMVVGPLLGVAVLVILAGGLPTLLKCYQLSVSKNYQLAFAIATGDGPWSRYLLDLFAVRPIVVLLAVGAIFRLDRTQKAEWFLTIFIAASYLIMCNVKYGMNLRYANMWDMPLSFLAFTSLNSFAQLLPRHRQLVLGCVMTALCATELRQYFVLFVDYPLYEPVPEALFRALHIIKPH
jgi:Dolichyl-phosphate-mannose-protein mannosyltransferase